MQVRQTSFVVCVLSFVLIGVCNDVAKAGWIVTRDFPTSQGNNEFYRQRIIPGYESDGFITPTDSGEFRAQFHPDFPEEEPFQQKLGVGIQTSEGDLVAYAGASNSQQEQ